MVTMMSQLMHIESENYDFLMYTLNAGQPVPSLYTQYYRTRTRV